MLDMLPLTTNGKIDRRALPAPEGRPEGLAFIPPQTPTEEALASIWAQILKLDRVGSADNFFELGGHSLLAMRAIVGIRDAFSIEFPLRSLFEAPTLKDLAIKIDQTRVLADTLQQDAVEIGFV
jgi:acyl carrier protein